uniref:BED-type domain-containing protein n=1 Tax=Salix viminalis TaxID=40686 RepID=A0A6N2NBV1_SALVM
MNFGTGSVSGRAAANQMEWTVNNAFKTYKDMDHPKSMMDVALIQNVDPIDIGLGSSEKGTTVVPTKRKKTMTSVYLKFFETAPDGKSRRCKFCGQSYSIATATGNLGRHLSNRHPGYDKSGDSVTSSAPQPITVVKKAQQQGKQQMDYDHLNWLLIKWLILASLPPSTLEEKWLENSFKFLNPSIQLWSGEQYKAVFREVFRSMQEDVKATLEQVSSKVSIILDFWSSYEQIFYMSVTCQWIDENWSFQQVLLDICQIPYPCGGSEIYHGKEFPSHMLRLAKNAAEEMATKVQRYTTQSPKSRCPGVVEGQQHALSTPFSDGPDFLAVQPTSIAPEDLFCSKGDEIDKQRFCMPHDSTQAILCIRSWTQGGIKLKYKSTEIDYERLMELAAATTADNTAGLDKKQK